MTHPGYKSVDQVIPVLIPANLLYISSKTGGARTNQFSDKSIMEKIGDGDAAGRPRHMMSEPFELSREFPAVIFVNPDAGAGRAGARLPEIRELFAAHKVPAEFLITENVQ